MGELWLPESRSAVHNGFRWNKSFSIRQPDLYPDEDKRLQVPPRNGVIDAILNCAKLELEPPQRHQALRGFLQSVSLPPLRTSSPIPPDYSKPVIIDDRCDPAPSVSIAGLENVRYGRAWESPQYLNNPPPGLHVKVHALEAEELHEHLKQDVRNRFCQNLSAIILTREGIENWYS